MVDHKTTRTWTPDGRQYVASDPHVTVYMSNSPSRHELEGHLYLVHDRMGLPLRMAREHELDVCRGRPNPELWYYGTRSLVRFIWN